MQSGPKKGGLGDVIGVASDEKEPLMKVLADDFYIQTGVAEYQILDFDCKAAVSSVESLKESERSY